METVKLSITGLVEGFVCFISWNSFAEFDARSEGHAISITQTKGLDSFEAE